MLTGRANVVKCYLGNWIDGLPTVPGRVEALSGTIRGRYWVRVSFGNSHTVVSNSLLPAESDLYCVGRIVVDVDLIAVFPDDDPRLAGIAPWAYSYGLADFQPDPSCLRADELHCAGSAFPQDTEAAYGSRRTLSIVFRDFLSVRIGEGMTQEVIEVVHRFHLVDMFKLVGPLVHF